MQIAEFPQTGLPADHPLLAFDYGSTSLDRVAITGVYPTSAGPMLTSSRPILTSEKQGPPRGALIMGRLLSKEYVRTLAEQTQVNFRHWPVGDNSIPQADRQALKQISKESPQVIHEQDKKRLRVYAALDDIAGRPAVLLRAELPREITPQGKTAMTYDRVLTLGVMVIMVTVLLVLLERTVVQPIAMLTRHTRTVAREGDLAARLDVDRADEIGILARQFDRMLVQLRDAQAKALDDSYYSGMTVLAAKALHDIRKALGPVTTQLGKLREDLDDATLDRLQRALAQLTEDGPDADRLEELANILTEVNEAVTAMRTEARTKLDDLVERTAELEMTLADPRYFQRREANRS
jgi:methyl-accepting chemotaxis protein